MIHLREKDKTILETLLKKYLGFYNVKVVAYGSRTNGKSHDTSDLDLVVKHNDKTTVPLEELSQCIEAIQESEVAIIVELRDYYSLPNSFQQEIDDTGEVFWSAFNV